MYKLKTSDSIVLFSLLNNFDFDSNSLTNFFCDVEKVFIAVLLKSISFV